MVCYSTVLPPFQITRPLTILLSLPLIQIPSRRQRFEWLTPQLHVGLAQQAMAFASIAGRTGGHQIFPRMRPTGTARDNVVDREVRVLFAAILAAKIITAKDFVLAQLHTR